MAADFLDSAVCLINTALNSHDYMRAQDEIDKVEIAGFKNEADSLRRCAGSWLSPPRTNGHISKHTRKTFRGFKDNDNTGQAWAPAKKTLGSLLEGNKWSARQTRALAANRGLIAEKLFNSMVLIPYPNGGTNRMRERLPSITMIYSREKERFQIVPHPVVTATRTCEKLPCREMLIFRNKHKYQIVVHPNGGSPHSREKLPSIDMIRWRQKDHYQIVCHPNGGNPRMKERLPSISMLLRGKTIHKPEEDIFEGVVEEDSPNNPAEVSSTISVSTVSCSTLIVPPDGGHPRMREALPSPEMLIRRRIRLEQLEHLATAA